MRQFAPSRAFFIYWGLHSIILLGCGLKHYVTRNYLSLFTFDNAKAPAVPVRASGAADRHNPIFDASLNPLVFYTLVNYYIIVFYAHTQSSTRFFCTNPYFFWLIANYLVKKQKQQKYFSRANIWVLFYLIYFNVAGIILFTNFLPWT